MEVSNIMIISRLLTGVLFILVGSVMVILPVIVVDRSLLSLWLFGFPLIIIGVVFLLNKNEDVIEKIHGVKGGIKEDGKK